MLNIKNIKLNRKIRKHIGEYRYAFSVVLTVYNLEKYVAEAIESIVYQTVNFRKYIQLIIVDDGSEDDSEAICRAYAKKFPENIKYIRQANGGVSNARNKGLEYANGKYVTFFDGDDIWELDAFEYVWGFFEQHYDDIDIIACRRKWFEGFSTYAGNDFRFKNKPARIIDVNKEPSSFHLDVNSTFIKREVAKANQFNENLVVGEDSLYINKIILEKCCYGAVPEAQLNMRRRIDGSSLTQSEGNSIKAANSAYTDTLRDYYEFFYDYSIEKFGKVIPYVQYFIMDAIRYRTAIPMPEGLDRNVKENYIKKIKNLLDRTDIKVLMTLKRGNIFEKTNLLEFKDPEDFMDKISAKGRDVYYDGTKIGKLSVKTPLKLESIEIEGDEVVIRGTVTLPRFFQNPKLLVKEFEGEEHIVTDLTVNIELSYENILGNYYKTAYNFEARIPECEGMQKFNIHLCTDTEPVALEMN